MRFSLPRISRSRLAAGVFGLFLLFLLFSAGRAQAQQSSHRARSPEAMAERMVTAMTKQLDLSQDQQTKVRSIVVSTLEDRRALMKKGQSEDADRKAVLKQMQQMQAQRDEKIAQVLDDEQLKKYRALRQKKRQKQQPQRAQSQGRHPQRNVNPAEAVLNQLNAQLDLTSEQQTKIRTIITDQVEQAKQLRQQLANADPQQHQELMKQAQKMQRQTKQRIEKVLTDEQVQTLRQRSMQKRQQQGGGGNQ